GGTGDAGQQGPAQGVAEGVPEARLQRLDGEPRPGLGDDLLGQGGTLCDEHGVFLSTGDRYMTPSEGAGPAGDLGPPLSVAKGMVRYAASWADDIPHRCGGGRWPPVISSSSTAPR